MTGIAVRRIRLGAAVAAALGCGLLAAPPGPAAQAGGNDLKKLAGVWHVVAEEFKGEPRPREDLLTAKATLTVSGDKFVFETDLPEGGKAAHTGTAVLDATARPGKFDWTGTGPKGAALERVGLYELTDAELKIVYVQRRTKKEGPVARPAAFATAADNNYVVVTYRRKPPGAADESAPAVRPAGKAEAPPAGQTAAPPAKAAAAPAKVPPPVRVPPAHVLQTAAVHRIEAVLTVEHRYPNLTAEEWVVIAPRLPELPSQARVSTVMDPAGTPGGELSDLARPVLTTRLPAKGEALKTSLKVKLTFQADMVSRQLVPLRPGAKPPAVKDLTDDERRLATGTSEHLDHGAKPFQDWLDKHGLRRKDKEADVDFALRVFQTIRKNCGYEAKEGMDHTLAGICKAGKSDCGGLSILFVSALRANGVPARVLVGRWARPGDKAQPIKVDQLKIDDYGGQHATAEFFAYGVGWVPADMAAGLADRSAAATESFGRDRGHFLTLHLDTDVELDTVHFGRHTLLVMQSPSVISKGAGKYDGLARKETWEVRKLR